MRWFLVSYRLPPNGSSARVAVWREVRRSGALQLQQSLIAFPDAEPFARAVARIRAAVAEVGGTALAVLAEPVDGADEQRLRSAWNEARAEEYSELISECENLVAEINKEFSKQKFTLAELDEEEAELDKLGRWRERIRERDVCGSDQADEAEAAFIRAREALARYTDAVFARTAGESDDGDVGPAMPQPEATGSGATGSPSRRS